MQGNCPEFRHRAIIAYGRRGIWRSAAGWPGQFPEPGAGFSRASPAVGARNVRPLPGWRAPRHTGGRAEPPIRGWGRPARSTSGSPGFTVSPSDRSRARYLAGDGRSDLGFADVRHQGSGVHIVAQFQTIFQLSSSGSLHGVGLQHREQLGASGGVAERGECGGRRYGGPSAPDRGSDGGAPRERGRSDCPGPSPRRRFRAVPGWGWKTALPHGDTSARRFHGVPGDR